MMMFPYSFVAEKDGNYFAPFLLPPSQKNKVCPQFLTPCLKNFHKNCVTQKEVGY